MQIKSLILKSDIALYYFFNCKLNQPAFVRSMRVITLLGETITGLIICAFAIVYQIEKGTMIGTETIFVMSLSQLLVHSIKRIVNRERPYETYEWSLAINPPKCKYSFPSGHTACAVALAIVLGTYFPFLKPVFYLLAFLVSCSRISLGFHYPTDVVAGVFLAYISHIAVIGLI